MGGVQYLCESASASMHFQPGEGPSRGLLRDCENRWIVFSSSPVSALLQAATLHRAQADDKARGENLHHSKTSLSFQTMMVFG